MGRRFRTKPKTLAGALLVPIIETEGLAKVAHKLQVDFMRLRRIISGERKPTVGEAYSCHLCYQIPYDAWLRRS
jgi:hypothetical protein